MSVTLTINGEMKSFYGDPRTSLLEVLRDSFRLTGTKNVCGEGFCGACTIYVDGTPVMACLKPVGTVGDGHITTIEGLARLDELNPVQVAFEAFDVVQCGMCFPGMVISMTDFLNKNPRPDREEIKAAMTGNICRCTGYERIIDAIMSLQNPVLTKTEAGR